MSPLISVIIPTYNRAPLVVEAVDSVLAQSCRDFELIVIDDGSTDDTEARLALLRGRLHYLRQERSGVSAARNRGLALASGEWVAFLDSDDLWLPRKLELQTDFLARHPEAEICQTEEIWIRNGRRVNPRLRHAKPAGDIFEPSLALCLVSPSAVMLRKSLLATLGPGPFDPQLPACEDYDLWLRIACRKPVFLIEEALVIKRGGHADQLSRSTPALDRYRIQALIKLLQSDELSAGQSAAAFRELERKCRIYGQGCLKRGKTEEGEYYLGLPGRLAGSSNAGFKAENQ
ncbi:MAG: glycosyltransferase [Deltaproteobacteria bacterium]|nr:glycosyltransferase [Deltaproteobacteria bacterium]